MALEFRHCGRKPKWVESVLVKAPEDWAKLYQYADVTTWHCRVCGQDLHYWQGVGYDGKRGREHKIKAKEWPRWSARCRGEKIEPEKAATRFALYVGEYTELISADTANVHRQVIRRA